MNIIIKTLLLISRFLNIGFYLWIIIRIYFFDRHITAIPYGETIGMLIYTFTLLVLIIVDLSLVKNEKKIENSKMKLLIKFIQLLIIFIHLLMFYKTFISIYIEPDISVSHYWESGEWKW
jgi:hypothetical protein